MTKLPLAAILFAGMLSVGHVRAQTPAPTEFEVASVKMADPFSGVPRPPRTAGGPGTSDPRRVTFTNYSMGGLLQTAFDLRFDQIAGPDWFRVFGPGATLYDISATLPEGTSQAEFHLMLRNLLISRFALATHFDKKETTAYRLVKGSGAPKLKPSAPDTPPDRSGGVAGNQAHRHFAHETVADLVGILAQQLGHPVTDGTGIEGEYDFELSWTASQPGEFSDGPDLPEAVRSQLGLRLEATKGSESVLVVDHVEKLPSSN